MFNFSAFCKVALENDVWKRKGDVTRNLCEILVKNYDKRIYYGDNTPLIKIFNGKNTPSTVFAEVEKDCVDGFSKYINDVLERFSLKIKKNEGFLLAEKLNDIIKNSSNLSSSVYEGLLKSYEINHSKRVFLYLSEALYYSLLASCKKKFEYESIKGAFSEVYQELLTLPPYAITNTYKERTEESEVWNRLINNDEKLIVQGLSGIGKSEFAKNLWRTVRENGTFKYLAWINYEGNLESSIFSQFLDFEEEEFIQIKRHILFKMLREMDYQLFIIIDNFYSGNVKDEFLQKLSGFNCHILVTTKELLDYSGYSLLELSTLSFNHCISLFKDYYYLENNLEKISEIISVVGRHTLLIELIAKNATEEEFSLNELIEMMAKEGISYSDVKINSNHELLFTEETIIKHTQILFSSIQKRINQKEIDILTKFSIYKSLPLDKEMLREWFQVENFEHLSKLIRLGWIKRDTLENRYFEYSIHEVPAFVILSQYSPEPFFKHLYPIMSYFSKRNILL